MANHETSPTTQKPDWRRKFEAVLVEADSQNLSQLVAEAEAAIFLRYQAVDASPDGREELDAPA